MSFTVSIADTSFRFQCETNESVLDATQRAGLEIPFSCRKGVCGTCKGRIVSGEARAFSGDALSAAERAQGLALFCNARPRSDLVIAPRSVAKTDPFARKTTQARVFRLKRLAPDVMLLHLRFPAGIRVKFKAGQHLNLILGNGERRDFSMANPPSESDGAQLHIRYVPGGPFTTYVFETLKHGDVLNAELPFGDFILRQTARPVLFVAGSTGFAPIQSMVEDAMNKGMTRDMIFYWGARQRTGLYSDLPQKWAKNNSRFKYVPVISEMHEPGIRHNLVHRAVLEDFSSLEQFDVYACGVPAMIQAAETEFVAAGLPREQFFADAFVTRADVAAAGP